MNLNPFSRFFSKPADEKTTDDDIKIKTLEGRVIDLNELAQMGGSQSQYLKLDAVYSCLRDKSETIGQLPVKLYSVAGDGKRTSITSGRSHRIFTQKPCDFLTMQGFLEMMVWWYERRGAFYAYIVRNDRGSISQIIPFFNQNSVVANHDFNGNVFYTYTTNDGKPNLNYHPDDLFIINAATLDGYTPIGTLAYNATLLGMAKTQEEGYEALQNDGITAQMALSTDHVFNNSNGLTRIQNDWKEYRGTKGRSVIPILENGVKPVKLNLTPQEQELLESRTFSVNRICRIFRVPLHRAGIDTKASTQSIFELDEAYMRDGLNPIMRKFEYAMNELTGRDMRVEFNRRAYFAGSPWRLGEAIDKVVKGGLMSINEGREDLGLERVEGGDVYAVDNNNVVYATWEELPEVQKMIYNQQNQTEKPSAEGETNDE